MARTIPWTSLSLSFSLPWRRENTFAPCLDHKLSIIPLDSPNLLAYVSKAGRTTIGKLFPEVHPRMTPEVLLPEAKDKLPFPACPNAETIWVGDEVLFQHRDSIVWGHLRVEGSLQQGRAGHGRGCVTLPQCIFSQYLSHLLLILVL